MTATLPRALALVGLVVALHGAKVSAQSVDASPPSDAAVSLDATAHDDAAQTEAAATTADAETPPPDAASTTSDAALPTADVASDPVREEARGHFTRGVQYIEAARWADAIAELERARELRVTPPVLYNLGLAYRAVGRNREAMAAFRAFSRIGATGASPELLGRVDGYIRELASGLGWLEFQLDPPTARVRIDGTLVAIQGPLEVDPGRRVVQVEADGFSTETRTLEVRRGAQASVVIRMVPTVLSSRVTVRAEPPNALVRIDGHDVGFGFVEEIVRPGSHTIEVSAEGHRRFSRDIEAYAGQSQTVRAVLSSNRTVFESPWFWVGVGVVAAGAGVAAWFLLQDLAPPYRGTLGTVTDAISLGGAP